LGIDEEPVRVEAGGLAEAADWDTLCSGETYVGYGRGAGRVDSPRGLALNHWALSGDWAIEEESALLSAAGGSVTFRFHARDLNLVLAPPTTGAPARFTVLLDGQPPGDDHGLDINELGEGTVDEPRMYQLVRQHRGAERAFEITFLDGPTGVRLHLRLMSHLVGRPRRQDLSGALWIALDRYLSSATEQHRSPRAGRLVVVGGCAWPASSCSCH
jgi:hypothetical protein